MSNNQSKQLGRNPLLIKLSSIPLAMLLCGSVFAQPVNDDCSSASVIPGSAPNPVYSDSVDATDATLDPADPLLSCNGPDDGDQTVWWEYTPDADGTVNFSTVGSTTSGGGELDTAHGVFTGSCGALVEVGCADFGLTDDLVMDVQAGVTYRVKVGQFAGGNAAGTVVMSVEPPPPVPQYVFDSYANGTTRPVRDVVADLGLADFSASAGQKGNKADVLYEVPNFMKPESQSSQSGAGIVGSKVAGGGNVKWNGPADLLQVFDGGVNDDNWDVLGTLIAPPDTVGDVGPNHYVQMYNLLTEIFDKEGNSILGPFPTSAFFEGLLGASYCAYDDDGDPIVIYDEETDRWLVSQFLATNWYSLCVAVSTSGDPTGSYNVYEFDFYSEGLGFPDYPKFGFSTGAVNTSVNLFRPFQGPAIGAIDKAELLAGVPATMVVFVPGGNTFGFVPGDNDGPVFDNTLPTFFTNNGGSGDTIDVWEVTPDWVAPEDSTIAEVANIAVSPWDSNLCNGPRGACIDQPGSGTSEGGNPDFLPATTQVIAYLEGITDRMMFRGQTRDFGKRKVAMLSHTVDADGTGKAGVRWYELRNDKDMGWKLKKEETFSPDGDHRWMGSVAMTASGDTCLGYSISSATTYPSIGITGRKGTSNHMNIKEVVAYDGNVSGGVQRGVARWGDYSAMSIDPVDDTCWYTTEVPRPNQAVSPSRGLPYGEYFGWGTKIIQYDVK
ncbi:MAG: hypothetical protein WBS20_02310 [Lysobacterales bacterium]